MQPLSASSNAIESKKALQYVEKIRQNMSFMIR